MDKRKRALGLRKQNGNLEDIVIKSKAVSSKSKAKSINTAIDGEEKIVKEGVDGQRVQAGSVTPKHGTPKRNGHISSLKSDSPCSPLLSPGYQSMFPRTLGSPEIEVSWDWGCSQVPKDMLPLRRVKRVCQSQPPPLSIVTPFTWRLLDKQMSEEENQERLAFYKNILSKSLSGTPDVPNPEHLSKALTESGKKKEQINAFFDDSANEFMLECSQAIEEKLKNGEIDMGPIVNIRIPNQKHAHSPIVEKENAHKRACHSRPKLNLFPEAPKNLDQSNSVGEKQHLSLHSHHNKQLKNKQCQNFQTTSSSGDNADFENDDILFMRPTQPNQGLAMTKSLPNGTSSVHAKFINCENNNNYKTNNKARVTVNNNLEAISNSVLHSSSDSKQSLLNRPFQEKHELTSNNISINNGNFNVSAQHICDKNVQKNVNNTNYDSVSKFRRGKNGNPMLCAKQSTTDPLEYCNVAINKLTAVPNSVVKTSVIVNETKTVKSGQENRTDSCQGSKPSTADITSLLDDGFDMELSNLDFDSLCCEPKKLKVQPDTEAASKTAPKQCSQQEIEAKRVAALNRLMLKKRK